MDDAHDLNMAEFLLWDHDGVLVDTERLYFAATQESLASLGVRLDHETYLRFMAQGKSGWDLAIHCGVSEATIAKARQDRDSRYQELLRTEQIEIDGVIDVLEQLSSRYRMAIVSASRRVDFELIHASRNIRPFFEFVINIEDCSRAKPDPDPYLKALERFHAKPDQALAIEDSARGLSAAISAGLQCVIIRSEFTAPQDFTGAWRVLDSVRELPAALAD